MHNRIACDTCPPSTFWTCHEAVFIGKTILTVITARHAAGLEMAAIEAGLQSKAVISGVLRLAVVSLKPIPKVTFGMSLHPQIL